MKGEGSVGDVLSYMTREAPGETGSLGQNKIKATNVAVLMQSCAEIVLTLEPITKFVPGCKAKNNVQE